jgi:outer membrane protein OmpA-like peptidoglycan-associated protein
MRLWKTRLALFALVLATFLSTMTFAQDSERAKRRQLSPTITGGTGLFTVYDSSTLQRGEIRVGFFANNYDRDPGNVDILQFPASVAVGVRDNFEVFINTDGYQRLISGAPFELSGTSFPGLTPLRGRFGTGSVETSFPGLGMANPAFFGLNGAPVSGALAGGILPGLPNTGSQQVFDPVLGRNKTGFQLPGFLNEFPFLGKGGGTLGNVTFGGKYRFTSEDSKLGLAILGFARIPTVPASALLNKDRGGRLTQGSGAGATDFGVVGIFSPRFGRLSTHGNFGYVHVNDPETGGETLLDRSDYLLISGGFDLPINQYFQLVGEASYQYYIGDVTRNLNRVDPGDIVVGARFFPLGENADRRFTLSFGGGYRYFINNSGSEREDRFRRDPTGGGIIPAGSFNTIFTQIRDADYNGFVANVTFGFRPRKAAPPPPPPPPAPAVDPCANNRNPTISLTANKLAVKERDNETVAFNAQAADPEGGNIRYEWTASGGALSGDGGQRTWNSAGLAPGNYIIKVTVTDNCGNAATDSRSITVEKANRCPTVSVRANQTEVQEGSDAVIAFTVNGNDPDNDRLEYTWTSSRGTLTGADTAKQLNTTGLSAGTISVTVKVSDGQCSATDTVTVSIRPRPAKPTVFSGSCSTYRTPNDTRPDNACKRVLDDVAARLQNDRNATLLIDGHSDKGEKAGTAQRRAQRVRDYLVNEKQVDAGRIEIRNYDNARPDPSGDRNLNRRVIIHVVPQGAERPQ